MTRVLFVCLGNICRSPTAEGIFKYYVSDAQMQSAIIIDSAGTSNWHIGDQPDSRAIQVAGQLGVDISGLKARQVTAEDLKKFDFVIAMDNRNLNDLKKLNATVNRDSDHDNIHLFMDFAQHYAEAQVPDPYFGDISDFERTIDMIKDASQGLLAVIQAKQGHQ